MPHSQWPKWGSKARAAALTVAAHAFFLLLLLLERRLVPQEKATASQPAGQWITLTLPPLPPPPPEPEDESTPRAQTPSPPTAPTVRPPTAITLAPPATAPAPASAESTAPPARASPDWYAQAAKLAEAYAEKTENPPTFSPPVQAMREPCKPRVSSFWGKKKEEEDAPPSAGQMPGPTTMVGGMPIGTNGGALGGGAVGGAGIRIPLGKPEPNKHLFDDMVAGKTPVSSVPHHEKCD